MSVANSDDNELLFFETFSQAVNDVNEGPNLGLVQFPNPIVIREIRVVPLGERVAADFPGGLRLGATNPSSFLLEFFINDLTKSDACTFLDIGRFDYKQNANIKFVPKDMIPTDGLILRGMYSTLTLAVFGHIADISRIIPDESSAEVESQWSANNSDQMLSQSGNSSAENIKETIDQSEPEIPAAELFGIDYSKRATLPLVRNSESRASSLSSDGNRSGDRRHKFEDKSGDSLARESRQRQSSMRSPLSPTFGKRSNSKSKSRSTTPSSTKRFHYIRRTPSPSADGKSPKANPNSPPKHSSLSPRSPFVVIRECSRSPNSTDSQWLTPSPVAVPQTKSKLATEPRKTDVTVKQESGAPTLAFDDSELFEPLSPDNASFSDIAEKISDDENLDQIISEAADDSEFATSQPTKGDGFEEISSEEEYDDDGPNDGEMLMDYTDFDDYTDIAAFNPFQCEFAPLQALRDPSLSIYEIADSMITGDETKLKELINAFHGHERNEKWVEVVEQLSIELVKIRVSDKSCFEKLFEFVVDGLDFELALRQPMTAFKVRHIKAGLKLLIAISQTRDEHVKRLLDLNLLRTLIELYRKPYMTIPVRLLIIRGVDAICDTPVGVEHLIQHRYEWKSSPIDVEQTCYQQLLGILVEKPSTRIMVALTSLMKKIHLFEVTKYLSKVNDDSETMSEESVAICLSEIVGTYKNANNLLSQPQRYLPATKQFEIRTSPHDSYKAIYKYFRHNRFIESVTSVLSSPLIYSADAFDCILDLLNYLSNFPHGLKFLLSDNTIVSTNNLHKALMAQQWENDPENQIQGVGLKLVYRLQVLQLVDVLFSLNAGHEKSRAQAKENFDDPDLTATLHHLYTMIFSEVGREAVVQILSAEHNFDSILPFISSTGDKKRDVFHYKSVSAGYAVELCLLTIQLVDSNIMSFVENYGQSLLKVSENDLLPKLHAISNWLAPIKSGVCSADNESTFKNLMSIVKKHCDSAGELADTALFAVNPELITAVKLLQHLCVPSEYQSVDGECHLKYKYAIIQAFSLDCLTSLSFLLNKLCDTYLKPSHQSVALVGTQGSLIVHFVKPCVFIIKAMLTYLVSVRGSEFKDTSAVSVLLRLYSVMSFVPSSYSNAATAQQIQFEITEILLIYTELYLSSAESEEMFSKSVWTKMVEQTIAYTLSSPLTLLHGLSILSDILPQPLPLIVKQPMSGDEIAKTVNFRKLWSAHLHILNDSVDRLISSLILANFPAVQVLLKRVCAQLSDLSAPTSATVAKCVIEALNESLSSLDSLLSVETISTCAASCILNFIVDLSAGAPFRLAISNLIHSGYRKEEKCGQVLARLMPCLGKPSSRDNQLINSILTSIVEMNASLANGVTETVKTEMSSAESANSQSVNTCESLNAYFANRQVFVLATQLDDQSVPYWASDSTAANDECDQFDIITDLVRIDLLELSAKYMGADHNIHADLEKLWSEPLKPIVANKEMDLELAEKKKYLPLISAGHRCPIGGINDSLLAKRMPQRGRGRSFVRQNDPFRSRPPNTSRPPSMHVDDFVAMERNDSTQKRTNKEFGQPFARQPRQSVKVIASALRSQTNYSFHNSYGDGRRPSPSSANRYSNRNDGHSIGHSMANTNQRVNRNAESGFQSQHFRQNKISANRYDSLRYPYSYSKSFQR